MADSYSDKFEEAKKLHQNGDYEQATLLYRELLKEEFNPHLHYLLGISQLSCGNAEASLRSLEQFVQWKPDHLQSRLAMGEVLLRLKQTDAAFQNFNKALELDPNCREACIGIGKVYELNKAWSDLEAFSDALFEKYPNDQQILKFRLQVLREKQDFAKAIHLCVEFMRDNGESKSVLAWYEDFFKFIHKPSLEFLDLLRSMDSPKMKMLTFRALVRANEVEEALALFEGSENEIKSSLGINEHTVGMILKREKFLTQAEVYLKKHLYKHSDNFKVLSDYIEICLALAKEKKEEKFRDARELAEYWLSCEPNSKGANAAMGRLFMAISRPELSLPYWDKVVGKDPSHPMAQARIFNLNYDERLDPKDVFEEHLSWGQRNEKNTTPERRLFHVRPDPEKPLRIGYVSPDFGMHPVGFFFVDVLKNHNFEEFQFYLYSNRFAEEGDDPLSKDLRRIVGEERWHWTRGMTPKNLEERIRSDKIDILVEMAGHTAYNRLDVIIRRSAPIQVEWLGYPNTTGLKTMDYRFSDAVTEPAGEIDGRSTEKIYRLPNGFHSFQKQDLPEVSPAPCLENGYITFGSYNNMNKLGSSSIALWSALLKRVKGSRIILKHGSLSILDNRESLLSNFAMHGIPRWRIILRETTKGHIPHLKSYGDMDIALDPIAYNGTTTTCDALSMGVPVLTMPGATHASRVTSSLLHRIGLDDWIAEDWSSFLRIGEGVVHNPQFLNDLRSEIRRKFEKSPLQDGRVLARDLENAYRIIWQKLCDVQKGNPFISIKSQTQ